MAEGTYIAHLRGFVALQRRCVRCANRPFTAQWPPVAMSRAGPYDRRMPAILYPHPPLVGEGFVLRRLRARDFNAAAAAREDPEAAGG